MILEEATKEAFGYYASELKPQSNKQILAACELCGKFRILKREDYRAFCKSCIKKGEYLSEKTRALKSAAIKGKNHPNYGKRGGSSLNYKGGKKLAQARMEAKRKRELGYTLLLPLEDGEVGHHVTDEYVIGILKDVHQRLTGGGREKHRGKVLQWLKMNDEKKYKIVLSVLTKFL